MNLIDCLVLSRICIKKISCHGEFLANYDGRFILNLFYFIGFNRLGKEEFSLQPNCD
jgi:hypothetical protein